MMPLGLGIFQLEHDHCLRPTLGGLWSQDCFMGEHVLRKGMFNTRRCFTGGHFSCEVMSYWTITRDHDLCTLGGLVLMEDMFYFIEGYIY